MKNVVFAVVLVALYGCGGEPFSTAFSSTTLDAPDAMGTATGGAAATGGAPGKGGTSGGSTATGGAPEVDAGSGGAPGSTGGSPATGGALETGGAVGTGGVIETGGVPTTGGAPGTGGAPVPCNGAGFSTHHTGVGQTWTDCVPLGTYDNAQAMKACEAWCTVNVDCTCSAGAVDVLGNGGATNAVYGDIDGAQMIWLWKSPYDGDTMRSTPKGTPWVKIGTWN